MLKLLFLCAASLAITVDADWGNWIHDTESGPELFDPCVKCSGGGVIERYTNPDGASTEAKLHRSCSEIKRRDRSAPSGEYYIRTNKGQVVQVYCEMGLNKGGWTFIKPASLYKLTQGEMDGMRKNKRCVLMRLKKRDGTQPSSLLCQLPAYRRYGVGVRVSNYKGYTKPVNVKYIGGPYLQFGWIPASKARAKTVQGLTSNSKQVTFRNCDRNPNSHITLFVNPHERRPTTYGNGWGGGVSAKIAATSHRPYSGRFIPADYFYFTELHWGGCGVYGQTDAKSKTYLGSTIGFQ